MDFKASFKSSSSFLWTEVLDLVYTLCAQLSSAADFCTYIADIICACLLGLSYNGVHLAKLERPASINTN